MADQVQSLPLRPLARPPPGHLHLRLRQHPLRRPPLQASRFLLLLGVPFRRPQVDRCQLQGDRSHRLQAKRKCLVRVPPAVLRDAVDPVDPVDPVRVDIRLAPVAAPVGDRVKADMPVALVAVSVPVEVLAVLVAVLAAPAAPVQVDARVGSVAHRAGPDVDVVVAIRTSCNPSS